MGECHDLYLKTDVILLNNIFEAFRSIMVSMWLISTLPGVGWQACQKKMGKELELLTNPDMLLMFKRGIRKGITQSVHRYATTNNKYMGVELK